jgi:hypothetical protein
MFIPKNEDFGPLKGFFCNYDIVLSNFIRMLRLPGKVTLFCTVLLDPAYPALGGTGHAPANCEIRVVIYALSKLFGSGEFRKNCSVSPKKFAPPWNSTLSSV